jgi:hypothetical protein
MISLSSKFLFYFIISLFSKQIFAKKFKNKYNKQIFASKNILQLKGKDSKRKRFSNSHKP